jgi:uncharacterized protein YkwD
MARNSTVSLITAIVVSFSVLSTVLTVSAYSSTSASDVYQYLSAHNTVREKHGAANLTWNDTLADAGQQWANGCKFEHSGGSLGPYGGK